MEAAEIVKRGMKDAAKEADIKAKAKTATAADSVSSSGTSSTANFASTYASAFKRAPTSNSIVVGVARRSGREYLSTILELFCIVFF